MEEWNVNKKRKKIRNKDIGNPKSYFLKYDGLQTLFFPMYEYKKIYIQLQRNKKKQLILKETKSSESMFQNTHSIEYVYVWPSAMDCHILFEV